jgi:hypothetical protein
VLTDGYYPVSIACSVIGLFILFAIIRPQVKKLEVMPDSVWRLEGAGKYGYSGVKMDDDVEDVTQDEFKRH